MTGQCFVFAGCIVFRGIGPCDQSTVKWDWAGSMVTYRAGLGEHNSEQSNAGWKVQSGIIQSGSSSENAKWNTLESGSSSGKQEVGARQGMRGSSDDRGGHGGGVRVHQVHVMLNLLF